jgi:hypothetical protein
LYDGFGEQFGLEVKIVDMILVVTDVEEKGEPKQMKSYETIAG